MIDCKTAWKTLKNINMKKVTNISSTELNELLSMNLISKAASVENARSDEVTLSELQRQLKNISNTKKDINTKLMDLEKTHRFLDPRKLFKTNSEYKTLRTQLTEYESQENKLRTQFLNLLQKTTENQYYATVNSEPVYPTYKGRELLGTLSERLKRVGKMDLKQYIQELEDIKTTFDNTAKSASEILRTISPTFKNIEEIHLRFSAVGLAVRPRKIEETV